MRPMESLIGLPIEPFFDARAVTARDRFFTLVPGHAGWARPGVIDRRVPCAG